MKNNQSGRSMVEMLGVLAIIGVLSIGGIAGYSYAMRRHIANGILNDLNRTAQDISGFLIAHPDQQISMQVYEEEVNIPSAQLQIGCANDINTKTCDLRETDFIFKITNLDEKISLILKNALNSMPLVEEISTDTQNQNDLIVFLTINLEDEEDDSDDTTNSATPTPPPSPPRPPGPIY